MTRDDKIDSEQPNSIWVKTADIGSSVWLTPSANSVQPESGHGLKPRMYSQDSLATQDNKRIPK